MNISYDTTSFDTPVWICVCEGYMYIELDLLKLIDTLNKEWKHDKHLVG